MPSFSKVFKEAGELEAFRGLIHCALQLLPETQHDCRDTSIGLRTRDHQWSIEELLKTEI